MTADAVAAVMFTTVTLYAVFAGADFGTGLWDLLAGGAKKGAPTVSYTHLTLPTKA